MPSPPKAIEQLLKEQKKSPRAARLLQKLAELYQKWGDPKAAAANLDLLAQVYSGDGFFLKAAAVAKQVLKLDPAMVATRVFLAEVYERVGLLAEAAGEYKLAMDHYQAAGNSAGAGHMMDALARGGTEPGKGSKD